MYADVSIHSSTLEVMMRFQDGRIYKETPITDIITYLLFFIEYYEDVDFTSVKNDEEETQHFVREFEDGVKNFLQLDNFLTNEGVYPKNHLMETMVISGIGLITMGVLLGRRYEMSQIARVLNNNFKYATEEDREEWEPKYLELCDIVMKTIDNADNKRSELELKEKMTKYVKWAIIAIIIWYVLF